MPDTRVVIIGAGIGGLVSALLCAARGCAVTVVEAAATPGGKMREITGAGGARVDAGPTVLTMRWVFEQILAAAGADFGAEVPTVPAAVLARHAWGSARFDLHADPARAAHAVGAFAGAAEARRFTAFLAEAARTYAALERSFLLAPRPTQLSLVGDAAARGGLADLIRIRPYETLWRALGRHFHEPRLRQLFGRYATYGGSSPFAAPATLMLIAHVEQSGVWLVDGGMHRVARALERVAARKGAMFRYGARVATIDAPRGRVAGVTLASGEYLDADAVIVNADPAALAAGRFGGAVARAVPGLAPADRSLSAVTLTGVARTSGFPLSRHNVFFGADYPAEFAAIARGDLPPDPTLYVCAQDRGAEADHEAPLPGPERVHMIMNAPSNGDRVTLTAGERTSCARRIAARLAASGLTVEPIQDLTMTTPADFDAMFPGTGGALYGRATHGSAAAFQRPPARTRMPGLYLAGGGTHPGAGVPMAALSGRFAAAALLADHASTGMSVRAAMPGGISTR